MICSPEYKPPLAKIRVSCLQRAKEYFRENSLHGVAYFSDSSRPKWERVVWLVCTSISLITAIGIILIAWEKFRTNPTLTGSKTFSNDTTINFPNLMLCSEWPFPNDSSTRTETEITGGGHPPMEYYRSIYEWKWVLLNSSNHDVPESSFAKFFYDHGESCGNAFRECSFRGLRRSCEGTFKKVITPVGVCCRFFSEPIYKRDDDWSLSFLPTKYPLRVYTWEISGAEPHYRQPPSSTITGPVEIDFSMVITETNSNVRYLTQSQRQCSFDDESPAYSRCIMKCARKKTFLLCGCVPWFLSYAAEEECRIAKYSCLIEIRDALRNLRCPSCHLSCNHATFSYDRIRLRSGNAIRITIKMGDWPRVIYERTIAFGWLDLFVSFGGIASLCLGYSLLTSVEFGYYFTLRSYCGAVLTVPKTRHNVVTVREIPKITNNAKREGHEYYDYIE